MRPEVKKYLFDMQQDCRLLTSFTSDKASSDYAADPLLRSAVERQFEIVGEALNQMLRLDPTLSAAITHARQIIAFRNILVHGYSRVSPDVVWGIVENDLPTLSQEVDSLLER